MLVTRQGRPRTAPGTRQDERAGEGTRTPNHLITNEMLYQLSYASGLSATQNGAKIATGFRTVKARSAVTERRHAAWSAPRVIERN